MGVITVAATIGGGPWQAAYAASTGFIAFYIAHWQEYV